MRIHVVITVVLLAASACAGKGHRWTRFQAADVPARVDAVVFHSGRQLDHRSSISYGQWEVAFDSSPPVLNGVFMGGGHVQLSISGLVCRNSVLGEASCSMSLVRSGGGYTAVGPPCEVNVPDKETSFAVTCPADVLIAGENRR